MHHDESMQRMHLGKGKERQKGNYFEDRDKQPAQNNNSEAKRSIRLTSDSSAYCSYAIWQCKCAVGNFRWRIFVESQNDYALIGWFTLATHLTMAITFWLAGKWVKEHNKMNCLRIGVAISAVFYMLVLWLGANSFQYFVWLGIVQGISAGLFWVAFNVVYFEVTDPDNRDRFNGSVGLLGAGAGIIAPWISGVLIVSLGDIKGYRLIFSISLGIFLLRCD